LNPRPQHAAERVALISCPDAAVRLGLRAAGALPVARAPGPRVGGARAGAGKAGGQPPAPPVRGGRGAAAGRHRHAHRHSAHRDAEVGGLTRAGRRGQLVRVLRYVGHAGAGGPGGGAPSQGPSWRGGSAAARGVWVCGGPRAQAHACVACGRRVVSRATCAQRLYSWDAQRAGAVRCTPSCNNTHYRTCNVTCLACARPAQYPVQHRADGQHSCLSTAQDVM